MCATKQPANKRSSSGWFETGSFLILIAAIFVSIRVFAVGPASILILLLVFMRLMPRVVAAYTHYQGIVNQLAGVHRDHRA